MAWSKEISFDKKYGRLTVIGETGRNKHGKIQYECICDCGNKKTVLGVDLRSGNTKSCGCYGRDARILSRKTHGQSHHNISPEYQTWKAIRQRCTNPNTIHWEHYGGKGVTVCERWNDFANFLDDMGTRPSDLHSIDRFPDTNGNYFPENCRWATDGEQSRNKTNSRWLEHNGIKMVLEDWATHFGVDQSTLHEHLETKSIEQIANFYAKKSKKLA